MKFVTDRQVLESFARQTDSKIEEFNHGAQVRINFVHRPFYFVLDVWPDPRKGLTKYHIVDGANKGERGRVKNGEDLWELLQNLTKMTHPQEPKAEITASYTINSDASFSMRWQRGAWAFWIKGEGFHVKASGVFPQKLASSALAELLAFEKGLQRINERVDKKDRRHTKLFVNTDCMYVIQCLEGKVAKSKNLMLIRSIQHACKDYEIVARHVRAHTGDLTQARSWVNDWCDQAAKAEMRAEGLLK